MRFHHSTRRGRNRLAHPSSSQQQQQLRFGSASARLQFNYCRETNIHFHRRLPINLPAKCKKTNIHSFVVNENQPKTAPDDIQAEEEEEEEEEEQEEDKMRQLLPEQSTTGKKQLDLESARQRLVAQVEKHPFWSSKAARRMHLTRVEERKVFIYELTSFCERRDLEWRFEPYRGGLVAVTPMRRLDPASPIDQSTAAPQSDLIKRRPSTCSPLPAFPASSTQQLAQVAVVSAPNSPNWTPSASISPSHNSAASLVSSRNSCQARRCISSGAGNQLPARARGDSLDVGDEATRELAWSIEPPKRLRPAPFTSYIHTCELPDSSFLKSCHMCQGRGRLKCNSCHGVGYEVCISCSGKGTARAYSSARAYASSYSDSRYSSRRAVGAGDGGAGDDDDADEDSPSDSRKSNSALADPSPWFNESCSFCHGAGQKRCWVCAGRSYNSCSACQGATQLRCYRNLTISWTNHCDEFVLNNADNIIPRERLRLSSGLQIVDEVGQPTLEPLTRSRTGGATGSAEDINQLKTVSKRLLERHRQAYGGEKLISQRQKVTQIECSVVYYEWKQRSGHFVIYGDERKVYIAKYPFKSICNIT